MATEEELIHEYPEVGRYRVRVVRKQNGRGAVTALDVREYVRAEKFEGFTRRGIRLGSSDDLAKLRDALADAASRGWFAGEPGEERGQDSEPSTADPTPGLFDQPIRKQEKPEAAKPAAVPLHVHVWKGSRTARVTDVANAGKRGKTCTQFVVMATCPDGKSDEAHAKYNFCTGALHEIEELPRQMSLSELGIFMGKLVERAREAGLSERQFSVEMGQIKGIHAPRKPLSYVRDGEWFVEADENGIRMGQLNDPNEWRDITIRQSAARAYEIAEQVFPLVANQQSYSQMRDLFTRAGARLHGYCGMD
jgi:hypothetical protein